MSVEDKSTNNSSRIVFVDPNDVNGRVYAGNISDKTKGKISLTPDYPDMCIAFNLFVEVYDRIKNEKLNRFGLVWTDKSEGSNSGEDFGIMGGSIKQGDHSYLSTFYTEISADGYKKSEQIEGLCVENVDISFDSYYNPTVVIKFVDIRGSAVFGREEAIHTSTTGDGKINSDNIFGWFFTVPHPKFWLQVKGFYGKDVTYELTLADTKAEFNSQTGNIEITASFVGYTWALLTDVLVDYIVAAPNCEYVGKEYWERRVSEGAFVTEEGTPMPKMADLIYEIEQCITEAKEFSSDEANILSENKSQIDEICDLVKKLEEGNTKQNVDDIEPYKTAYNDLFSKINEYNSEVEENKITTVTNGDDITWYTEEGDDNKKAYKINCEFVNGLKTEVTNLQSKITEELEKKRNEEYQNYLARSVNSLKIIPTVYNIFKLLMCHLETFCHIMFEAGSHIKIQQEAGDRAPESLNVNIDSTDIAGLLTKEEEKNIQIPAWTAVFNSNPTICEKEKLEYNDTHIWVGDLGRHWAEEDVVWGLYNAVRNYDPSKNSGYNGSDVPIGDTVFKGIPIFVGDIMNGFNFFNNINKDDPGIFSGHLGIRMAQIFGIMFNSSDIDDDLIEMIGGFDAVNFMLSDSSKKSINKFFEHFNENNAVEDIIDIITCNNNTPSQNGYINTYPFEQQKGHKYGKNNTRHPIFVKNGDTYKYVYFYDCQDNGIVPAQTSDDFKTFNVTPVEKNGGICFEGEIKPYSNREECYNWLSLSHDYDGLLNRSMFTIIEDENVISTLCNLYDNLKDLYLNTKSGRISLNKCDDFLTNVFDVSYDSYAKKNAFENFSVNFSYAGVKSSPDYLNLNQKCISVDYFNEKISNDENLLYTTDTYNVFKYKEQNYKLEDVFINEWGYTANKRGLFLCPFYYTQNNINNAEQRLKAKATIFVQTYWDVYNNSSIFPTKFNNGNMNINSKINLLGLGGLLWRQQNLENYGNDGLCYDNNNSHYKLMYNNNIVFSNIGCIYIYQNTTKKNEVFDYSKDEDVHTLNYLLGGEDKQCDMLDKLNANIKTQLISYFEKFALNDFKKIVSAFELAFENGNPMNGDDIIKFNDEFINEFNKKFKDEPVPFDSFDTLKKIKIPNGVYGITCDKERLYFLMDPNAEVQNTLKKYIFGRVVYLIADNINGEKNGNVTVSEYVMKKYLQSFVSKLKEFKEGTTEVSENNTSDNGRDTSDSNIENSRDKLLSIYIYCKNLWEKWLLPLFDNDVDSNHPDGHKIKGQEYYKIENFFDTGFTFIDNYYNDIGYMLMLNFDKVYSTYMGRAENKSLFSYIGDLTKEHRCLFVSLPDFVHLGMGADGHNAKEAVATMENMFKPMPYSKLLSPRITNNFVVIYTQPPASRLPEEVSHRYDGFDIYSAEVTPDLFKIENIDTIYVDNRPTKYGYNVPAFGCAYGKMNNHIFKELRLTMNNPQQTEVGINTIYNAVRQARAGDRQVAFYGQDVYNIYTNYSYLIEVEMMGNAQIQPLMYFQLMNVPMWRGAYLIYNVRHKITAGNMITTFKAMKMSKNPVPLLSKYWSDISEYYEPRKEYGEEDDCLRYEDVWVPDNGNSTDVTDDGPVDTVGLQALASSGKDSVSNKKHSTVNLTPYKITWACQSKTPAEYTNIAHNNYFDVGNYLTQHEFNLTGGKFNIVHMINYLYNICHFCCGHGKNPCKLGGKKVNIGSERDPTSSTSECAGYTASAVDAGFGATKDLMSKHRAGYAAGDICDKLGFRLVYHNPAQNGKSGAVYGSLPPHAYPGDIAWQDTTNGKGGRGGHHCQIFTGKHWVSDFIQRNGIVNYKGKGTGTIYKYYRIPGIEQVYKPSGVSSSQVATSTTTSTTSSSGGRYERKCVEWRTDSTTNTNNDTVETGTFDISGVDNFKDHQPVSGIYDLSYLKDAMERSKVFISLLRKAGANYATAIGMTCNANAETGVAKYFGSWNKTYQNYGYKKCNEGGKKGSHVKTYSGPWCAQTKDNKGYGVNEDMVKFIKKYSNINGYYINEFPLWAVIQGARDYFKDKVIKDVTKSTNNIYAKKYNQPEYNGKIGLWDYWQTCTDPEFVTGSMAVMWERYIKGNKWSVERYTTKDLESLKGQKCGPTLVSTIKKW